MEMEMGDTDTGYWESCRKKACTKKTYHLYRSWALAARLRLPSSGGRSLR